MTNEKLTKSLKKDIIRDLKNATGQDFVPLRILGSGASSLAVLVENNKGEKLVYKCDKKLVSLIERIKLKIQEHKDAKIIYSNLESRLDIVAHKLELKDDHIKAIQDKYRTKQSAIKIPQTKRFLHFTLEEYVGETATPELLSGELGQHLAKELAHFYLALHDGPKYPIIGQPISCNMIKYIPDTLQRFSGTLSSSILKQVHCSYKALNLMDNSDEVLTTIHGDFRLANLCYDKTTQKLAVIDWEFARYDNIYYEFLAKAVTAQKLPFSFIEEVIDEYNKFSDAKINKDKVKHLFILGIVNEYGQCAIKNGCTYDEFFDYYAPKIQEQIENITGEKDNFLMIN